MRAEKVRDFLDSIFNLAELMSLTEDEFVQLEEIEGDLARRGLQDALRALQDGSGEVVGTSGFTTREDILSISSPSKMSSQSSPTRVKGA